MGMQTATATGGAAGKTQQPPQPDIGQMKPEQIAFDTGQMKPQATGGDIYNTKPMGMPAGGAPGGEVYNNKPLAVGGDIGTMKPVGVPGGAPAPAPAGGQPTVLYNQNGVTLYSDGLRTFADGSSERISPEVAALTVNPNAVPWAARITGNGGPDTPAGGTGAVGGGGGGFAIGGSARGGPTWGGGGFGVAGVPGAVDDTSRRRVEEAILSRLEPQFRQDESNLQNQLLASGLEKGSPAYASELDRLMRGQNDARMSAIMAGGGEESRQVGLNASLQGQAFNQGMQGAQFDNATRQQMLSELLLQRNTPLNELNALRTGGQVSMPNFQGYYTNNAAAAPVFDAATAQGNYNAQQAATQQSGFNALVGGAATAAGMFF